METGTGKTYVYLRSIFELSRKYGFKKFIVVFRALLFGKVSLRIWRSQKSTSRHFTTILSSNISSTTRKKLTNSASSP